MIGQSMGYFSSREAHVHMEEREPSYPTRRETLQYFLEDLEEALEELGQTRPRNMLDPLFDRSFYSDHIVHYYEQPGTVQDILFCIEEVKELIYAIDVEAGVVEVAEQVWGQLSLLDDWYIGWCRAA